MAHHPPAGGIHTSNGIVTAPSGRGAVGANKKKQKRRAKQAAKAAADSEYFHQPMPSMNGQLPQAPHEPYHPGPHPFDNVPYDPQQYPDELDYTSEEDDDSLAYEHQHSNAGPDQLYLDDLPLPNPNRAARRTTASSGANLYPDPSRLMSTAMSRFPLPNPPPPLRPNHARSSKRDRIWNTSTNEERERIKEFWLSLSEQERRGLLKIEKAAVLNKMKEQQKHSCSCTVCGRKRTAIEEELEVLYDAYYEELAQYANQPNQDPTDLLQQRRNSLLNHQAQALPPPRPPHVQQVPNHRTSRVHEILDDGDEQVSDRDDLAYSDDEEEDDLYSDEDDYESDEIPAIGTGFFDFGNNLTVKGGSFITDMLTKLHGRLNNLPDGILTVADDLLKNDGRKFIEMMEQLAERRMRREEAVSYAAQQHAQGEPALDDLDDYDDEDDYDSQDDYGEEEEEDEMVRRQPNGPHYEARLTRSQGGMTEEQRMEEGRRMFQIFAARMFEQRVLTAYREKVALERQSKLLEELEEESKAKSQKDAKKAKDAEKKKNKKQAQKAAKAEEKARKEAEKAAEEAAAKAAEEARLDDQRRKKEEQRKKKEAEKKLQEQERVKKDAEKNKRLQEERERLAEVERKARESKAMEKKQKDEARKREREEREAKEREAREQKAHNDKMRKDQEARQTEARPSAVLEKESRANAVQTQPPQIMKRQSHQGQVAVPPTLVSQRSSTGVPSPSVAVATPALPKPTAPTVKHRSNHESEAGPQASALQQQQQQQPGASQNRKVSPRGPVEMPHGGPPKTILQNPHKHQQPRPMVYPPHPTTTPHPVATGNLHDNAHTPFSPTFGTGGYPSFTGHPPPSMPHQQRPNHHFGPQQPAHAHPAQFRPFKSGPGLNAPTNGFHVPQHQHPFTNEPPPGFVQPVAAIGPQNAPPNVPNGRAPALGHSRQQSSSNNLDSSPPPHAQPITRPAPIQRPSSVRPSPDHDQLDDLSRHLGSRALLDDADDPLPATNEQRRTSNPIGGPRSTSLGFSSPLFTSGPAFGNTSASWASSGAFGGPPSTGVATPSWGGGGLAGPSWSGSFGPRSSNPNRSRAIRLAVCQACRQLSSMSGPGINHGNDYHDVGAVLQQIDRNAKLDAPPTLKEIEDICETEGDAHNGGGLLHVRRSGSSQFAVSFEPDMDVVGGLSRHAVGQLGEIGSPIPGNSVPAFAPGGRGGFGTLSGLASPGPF